MRRVLERTAREKWCPFARVPLYENGSTKARVAVNRIYQEDEYEDGSFNIHYGARCIATECMAWVDFGDAGNGHVGFCGLVGEKK